MNQRFDYAAKGFHIFPCSRKSRAEFRPDYTDKMGRPASVLNQVLRMTAKGVPIRDYWTSFVTGYCISV